MGAHHGNVDVNRHTLADLLDAALASRDAFARAAEAIQSSSGAETVDPRSRAQASVVEAITAQRALPIPGEDLDKRPRAVANDRRVSGRRARLLPHETQRETILAALVAAILESRRSYMLARDLARTPS